MFRPQKAKTSGLGTGNIKAKLGYGLHGKLYAVTVSNTLQVPYHGELNDFYAKKHFPKDFIKFISDHRDYRVREPWTNVMFVDGAQLARLNFAMNSPARHSYIYIDAGSGLKELKDHLVRFEK